MKISENLPSLILPMALILVPLGSTVLSNAAPQPVQLAEEELYAEARLRVPPTDPATTRIDPTQSGFGAGLRETLQQMPGLSMQDSFGGFDPPRISVRGSGIQSAPVSRGLGISLNEFPLNFADGSFNLALVESSWIQRADLRSGVSAGTPHMGGALEFWTGAGLLSETGHASAAIGSDETVNLSAQADQKSGSAHWGLAGALNRTEGWRDHASQRRESVLAATLFPIAEHSEITIQFFGTRPRLDVPGPLPKNLALNQPTSNIERVRIDRPRRETEYAQLATRLRSAGPDTGFSVGAAGVYIDDTFTQLLPNGISTTRGEELAVFADAYRQWDGAFAQSSSFGLSYQGGWLDARRYANRRGSKGPRIGDNRLRPDSLTVSLEHRAEVIEAHTLALGASVFAARRKIDERFSGRPSTALDHSEAKVAPRASWTWQGTEGLSLSLGYARTYEPPTFDDLLSTAFNPPPPVPVLQSRDLQWQKADAFELRVHREAEMVSWTSALHYGFWEREFLRLLDENGASRGTVNAGDTIHAGWETGLQWILYKQADSRLSLWTTYQWNFVRFDDDAVFGNNKLGGVPPHEGAVGLRGDLPGGWFVSPGAVWQAGKTYADHANTLSSGGFALYSLDFGRAHPSGWTATVRILNAFDRNTIASTAGVLDRAAGPNQPIFLPAAERRVEARLEYTW